MTQYSKIGRPRIYVSVFDYIYALGIEYKIDGYFTKDSASTVYLSGQNLMKAQRMFGLSNNSQEEIIVPGTHDNYYKLTLRFFIDSQVGTPSPWIPDSTGIKPTQLNYFMQTINFDMHLGHNFHERGFNDVSSHWSGFTAEDTQIYASPRNRTAYINEDGVDGDGFSIWLRDGQNQTDPDYFYCIRQGYEAYNGSFANGQIFPTDKIKLSNIVYGTYYDFDQFPDLGVTQSFSYEGVDSIRTKGGSTINNVRYSGAPSWGTGAPFQNSFDLDSDFGTVKNMGRRSWDVSFSYIDEKKIMPYNSMGHVSGEYDDDSDSFTFNTSDTDKPNFVGSVLSKSLGGKLKFVWQPNVDVEEFYICTIPQNKIDISEVSNKVYNVSFTVEEAW